MDYDPEVLESPACPLCRSEDSRPISRGRDSLGVVRCRVCQLLFLSPRLKEEQILDYYRDGSYFEGSACGYTSYLEQEKSLRLTFRRLLRTLYKKGLRTGSLLEVGCGHGFFLEEARPYFSLAVGTDMSEAAASKARSRADQIWVGGVDAVPPEDRFDLVVALHVIEHVYDPKAFTRSLVSLLKPGGHLIMATPHAGSFWFHTLGKRWPSYKFPEHVVFYDKKSLTSLMEGAGLGDLQRIGYPHAFPVSEILRKVGLPSMNLSGRWSAWMPATTIALAGRREG